MAYDVWRMAYDVWRMTKLFPFPSILSRRRIAADLESNIRPTLPVLSNSGSSSLEIEDFDRPFSTPTSGKRGASSGELQRFAKSIKDIENVRIGVSNRLKVTPH
jgi:hypothetical protein